MSDKYSIQDEAPILNHEYDGIQERDNPLPAWWLVTFLGTIIFSFIYYTHYEISGVAPTLLDELKQDMAKIQQQNAASKSSETSFSNDQLQSMMNAAGVAQEGAAVFTAKCAACHGQNGEGLIGPNLTDHFWIHGKGNRTDVLSVVQKGVLEKGMPAWQGVLTDKEVIAVTAHIFALKDSNPANAKAPQGEEVK